MKWKRHLAAVMTAVMVAGMIARYDLAPRADMTNIRNNNTATSSNQNNDWTSGTIQVNSIGELNAALSLLRTQPDYKPVNLRLPFDDDYIPTEEEIFEWYLGLSPLASSSNATASNATASNLLMAPFSVRTIEFTDLLMDDFNNGTETIKLPGLAAGEMVILKNTANGVYQSKGYDHFTMETPNSGTYIFEDFTLYGGIDKDTKGRGGIKATGGRVELKNVEFYNFNSKAIYGTQELLAAGCVFQDFAGSYVITDENVTITNSLLRNCNFFGDHGSAVKIGKTLDISDSTVINCGGGTTIIGGYTAGAIAGIGGGKKLTVNNCYFSENHGNKYGGAISLYQYGGEVTITDSYFHNNTCLSFTSNTDGGAVGIFNNGQVATMTIDGCTFEGNAAGDDAGALFFESATLDPQVTLILKNSTFADNEAMRFDNAGSGGAVQLSLNVRAEITNNTFTGNVCRNPDSLELGTGAAVGSHYGRLSGLNFRGPSITFKNNLFVGNVGKTYSSSNFKQINVGGTMTITGSEDNIGYDYAAAAPADLTLESVYGVSAITAAENGSNVSAGCSLSARDISYSPVTIPTYWIAPAITDDSGIIINPDIHGDDAVPVKTFDEDQRDMMRCDGASDAGAVEIISAKFDANLGAWTTGELYTYDTPFLYVKALDTDSDYTYVYSAADPEAAAVGKPANPTRPLYYFEGWTNTRHGSDFVTDSADFLPGHTYYAKWNQTVNLDLTYHLNDGSATVRIDPDGNYPENTGVTVKTIADLSWTAPSDSYFKGWATTAVPVPGDLIYQPGSSFTITAGSHDLFAIWQQHYQLSYAPGADPATVTGMPPQQVDKIDMGQSIQLAGDIPVRSGWLFEGWTSSVSGDSTVYQPGQTFIMPGQNVVLTAVWTRENNLNLTYHMNNESGITLIDPDGSYPANEAVRVKSLADLSWAVPEQHRFKGWTAVPTPASGDTWYQKDDIFTLTTVGGHLYAQWVRLWTVTFESNGGSAVSPVTNIESGSAIAQPSVSRTGYTFLGWYTDDNTFLNQWDFDTDLVMTDMTLYAAWRRNGGGGGGGGGGGTNPTVPSTTAPPTEAPTSTPETVPPTTAPEVPGLPPGYYVKEENGRWVIFTPENVPMGYLGSDGNVYDLPKTGDKLNGVLVSVFSAAGLMIVGGVIIRRRRSQ